MKTSVGLKGIENPAECREQLRLIRDAGFDAIDINLATEGARQVMNAPDAEKKAEATGKPLPERITVAKALVQKAAAAENATLDAANLSEQEKQVMAGLTKKRGVSETPFRTIERETVVYKLKEAFHRANNFKKESYEQNEIHFYNWQSSLC